jgi:RNA methyltransferase, TrmH family
MKFQKVPLSPSQNQLKGWARLTNARFRRTDRLFLAEGVKIVGELLKSDWQTEAILVLPEKKPYWEKLIADAFPESRQSSNPPIYALNRSEWKKISQDKEPEGLLAIVQNRPERPLPEWLKYPQGHLLIGHEISNPRNLGALIRSARWFGFSGILLSGKSADWTNPKSIRASMGGLFQLPLFSGLQLENILPEIRKNYFLIGSDVKQGVSPHPLTKKAALLLGSESHGLPENILEQMDERWRIAGNSEADSLSLPQAAAVMMYEMVKSGKEFQPEKGELS